MNIEEFIIEACWYTTVNSCIFYWVLMCLYENDIEE
jgi:hypothetical protein